MYERLSPEKYERIMHGYERLAKVWGVSVEHAREMGMKTLLPGERPNNLKAEIIEGNAPTPGGPKPTSK